MVKSLIKMLVDTPKVGNQNVGGYTEGGLESRGSIGGWKGGNMTISPR